MRTARGWIVPVVLAALLPGCRQEPAGVLYAPAELSGLAGWKGANVNSPDAFRFVVMSDRTGGHDPGAWARAVEQVNRLKPDFVMCVGDLIEGYTDDADKARAEWKEFDALTDRLDAPFFYTAGNHDVQYGVTRAVYSARSRQEGKTWYSFDYRGCHFVVFDSTAIVNAVREVVDAQWAWLDKDLAAARGARHTFVFFHHPIVAGDDWDRIRKRLDPARTTIFTGHYHSLSYDREDGIPYYILGPTATRGNDADREKGGFRMFAHVAVSGGEPTIAMIPVGEVLPHNFISRAVSKRIRSMRETVRLSTVTRAAAAVTMDIDNTTDVAGTYTLTWAGPPKAETLTVGAGGKARRSWRVTPPATGPAPALKVDYQLTYGGRGGKGSRTLTMPVAAEMSATRLGRFVLDGRLDEWAAIAPVAADAKWQVRDNPDAWTGPADCTLAVRAGYDDKALYLAVDVTDDLLVTDAAQSWYRDGIEVFWDPRGDADRDGAFAGACRQLLIPVPADGEPVRVNCRPADKGMVSAIRTACRRRSGGYTFELAIPHAAIAKGFRPAAGRKLRLEILANDRDEGDEKKATTCTVLSADSDASKNTAGYAVLTFK